MTRARELAELASAYDSGSSMGFRNRIINGDMRIAQRGTSFTASSGQQYPVDRFRFEASNLGTWSVTQDASGPDGFSHSSKMQVTTANASPTSLAEAYFEQLIEGNNLVDLAFGAASALSFTLSFWVKASIAGNYGVWILTGGGRAAATQYSISAANTWERKTITVAGDVDQAIATNNTIGLRIRFYVDGGAGQRGTLNSSWHASDNVRIPTSQPSLGASVGNNISFTGVQLEAGSVASPFERRDYGRELMMCQRYYESGETTQVHAVTANAYLFVSFTTTKRTAPTVTRIGPGAITSSTSGTTIYGPNVNGFYWFQAASTNAIGGDYTATAEL